MADEKPQSTMTENPATAETNTAGGVALPRAAPAHPKSGYQRYVAILFAEHRAKDPKYSYKMAMKEAGINWSTYSGREALVNTAKQELHDYKVATGKKRPRDAGAVRRGRFSQRVLPDGWQRRSQHGVAYFVHAEYNLASRLFPCGIEAFESKLVAATQKPPKEPKAHKVAKAAKAAKAAAPAAAPTAPNATAVGPAAPAEAAAVAESPSVKKAPAVGAKGANSKQGGKAKARGTEGDEDDEEEDDGDEDDEDDEEDEEDEEEDDPDTESEEEEEEDDTPKAKRTKTTAKPAAKPVAKETKAAAAEDSD